MPWKQTLCIAVSILVGCALIAGAIYASGLQDREQFSQFQRSYTFFNNG